MKAPPTNAKSGAVKANGSQKSFSTEATASDASAIGSTKEDPKAPSTFELAMLAAYFLASPRAKLDSVAAVRKAMDLWCAAQEFNLAESQLKELHDGIFELTPDEWTKRVGDYCGDKKQLSKLLDAGNAESWRYHFEEEVLKKLYPAKGYHANLRLKKFQKLLKWAAEHGLDLSMDQHYDLTAVRKLRLDGPEGTKKREIPVSNFQGRHLSGSEVRRLVDAEYKKRKNRGPSGNKCSPRPPGKKCQ